MADLTVLSLKSCDTCRKALAELASAGRAPDVIDVRADGVPRDLLERLIRDLGPGALINRRSTTWRALDEAARERAMDPARSVEVLAANPTLMKRPVILAGDAVHVGWTPGIRAALGL